MKRILIVFCLALAFLATVAASSSPTLRSSAPVSSSPVFASDRAGRWQSTSPAAPEYSTPEPPTAPSKNVKITRTPRPTATPAPLPPPLEPSKKNVIVFFSFLLLGIVAVGVWINRGRSD